jgi:hypothetical protein
MEKHIVKASYWLGLIFGVFAVAWQLLRAVGVLRLASLTQPPMGMDPGTVLRGAVLFLVISIASASYESSMSRKG